MRRMNTEDALTLLARIEPRASHEMPRFITAPRYIEHAHNSDGSITMHFACDDIANARTWAIPLQVEPHETREPLELYARAIEQATKYGKAIFN